MSDEPRTCTDCYWWCPRCASCCCAFRCAGPGPLLTGIGRTWHVRS